MRPDDEALLDEIFDLGVQRHAAGEAMDLDALLDGREHLRERAQQLLATAREVAVAEPRGREGAPSTIAGYTIVDEVGAGGGGVVYRARQHSLGRDVALKVLPPAMLLSASARERFVAEARALGRVRHPNIVAVHDVVAERDVHALAMEWIEGRTLSRALSDPETQFSVRTVAELGAVLARALGAAHAAGLVHRDVKPSNVMLRADRSPVLIDFGLVRDAEHSLHTRTGEFLGTMAYASPEQLRGEHSHVGEWTDVYGLGVTLYAALAGKPPFGAASPSVTLQRIENGESTPLRRVNPQVPRDLAVVLAKAMDREPGRRYATALAFAEDMERFLAHQPILARPSGLGLRLQRWLERSPSLALALAGLVLALASGLGVAMWLSVGLAEQTTAARAAEAKARDESETQTQYADFLREVLRYGDALLAKGRADITVSEAIDTAAHERLQRPVATRPEVEATIRVMIAELLVSQGKAAAAEPHLHWALETRRTVRGPDSREVMEVAQLLARTLRQLGRTADAEIMLRDIVRIRRVLLATDPYGGPNLAQALSSHGIALRHLARFAEAETALVESLALYRRYVGDQNESVAVVLTSLTNLLSQTGRHEEAELRAQEALDIAVRFHGAKHLDVASAHVCRGRVRFVRRDIERGLDDMRSGWQMAQELVGDGHERTASFGVTYATHLMQHGDAATAEAILRQSHAAFVTLENAMTAAEAAVLLADALLAQDKFADVDAVLTPLVDTAPAPHRTAACRRLASALRRMQRHADGEPLLQRAWDALPDGDERRAVAREMVDLLEAWQASATPPPRELQLELWRSRRGS